MACRLKPLADRIVVKPDAKKEKTEGGIYLPDTVKEDEGREAIFGTVVCVGPGKPVAFAPGYIEDNNPKYAPPKRDYRHPMEVQESDKILYSRYAGNSIKIDGDEMRIISMDDVIAIVT